MAEAANASNLGDGGAGGNGGSGASTSPADGNSGGNPAPAWHGQTDTEAVAYIQNKGWQSPADVIKSYQGAEKLIGRDPNTLLVMPRADDPAGFRNVMAKLGMPDAADKYEIPVSKEFPVDEKYTGWAKSTFHKVGLTAAQAKTLSEEHNAFLMQTQQQAQADYQLSLTAQKQELLSEWRDGHERMMNVAQMAAKQLGFTGEMIDAMEKSVGYKATMKHFASLGQKMSEDGFVSAASGGGNKFGNALTPAEAKMQWETMKSDPIEGKALFDSSHPNHKAVKEKQARLFKIMYPD